MAASMAPWKGHGKVNEVTMTRWQRILGALKGYWYRYVIVGLLISLVAGFWVEWREEQDLAVMRLESEYSAVQPYQDEWLNASSQIISAAARPGAIYPDPTSLLTLHEAVRNTLEAMTAIYSPSNRLAESAAEYREALSDVAGAINQYTPNDAGMRRLLHAIQTASDVGGQYAVNVDEYRTEAWHSYRSVIF